MDIKLCFVCSGEFIDVLFGREGRWMGRRGCMQPPQTILQVNCAPCLKPTDYKIISFAVYDAGPALQTSTSIRQILD